MRDKRTYRNVRRNAVLRTVPKGVWGAQHYYSGHYQRKARRERGRKAQ